jgi:hypothetical protein
MFGGAWFFTLFTLLDPNVALVAVPVVGPFWGAVMGAQSAEPFDHELAVLAIMDGVLQVAGLTLLIVGVASPRQVLVFDGMGSARPRPARPQWALLPGVAGAMGPSAGATLALTQF